MKITRARIKNFLIWYALYFIVGLLLAYIFYDTITKEIIVRLLLFSAFFEFIFASVFSLKKKESKPTDESEGGHSLTHLRDTN